MILVYPLCVVSSKEGRVWGSSSVMEFGRDHCRSGLRFGMLNREVLVMTSLSSTFEPLFL